MEHSLLPPPSALLRNINPASPEILWILEENCWKKLKQTHRQRSSISPGSASNQLSKHEFLPFFLVPSLSLSPSLLSSPLILPGGFQTSWRAICEHMSASRLRAIVIFPHKALLIGICLLRKMYLVSRKIHVRWTCWRKRRGPPTLEELTTLNNLI